LKPSTGQTCTWLEKPELAVDAQLTRGKAKDKSEEWPDLVIRPTRDHPRGSTMRVECADVRSGFASDSSSFMNYSAKIMAGTLGSFYYYY
jgi:hypothetical protein